MSEDRRDWDRELADIDRAIAKQTSAPPPVPGAPLPGGPPAGVSARRRSPAAAWFWALLALALAVALVLWPYQRACGLQLAFFLGAAGVTALIGGLGALAGWASRSGLAHLVSLGVIVWAAVVGLREVLPRVGYAKTVRTWTCEATPAAPAGSPAPAPLAPAPQPAAGAEPAPAPAPR